MNNPWIEAMRLRTLPVSVAGVVMAAGFAAATGPWHTAPALLCLLFAILAQIASNFANEYYDYKAGLDRKGRSGPRRGVTEGDITPRAMLHATYATLAAACITGLSLTLWSGWWLIPIGILVALAVVAYSTGPWPLSHHGMGELAVIFFFGLIPVNLTYRLITGQWSTTVLMASLAIGLMGANVLIVNNYRDRQDDSAVGKHTLAVLLGPRTMQLWYLLNGYLAIALMAPTWLSLPVGCLAIPALYLLLHTLIFRQLCKRQGPDLNPLLGLTAILMLLYATAIAIAL